ncbi:adenosylcobinamide-phosphate synthase [Parabacteroides sp. PFB2-10]|uniref:adenosylcobinamide-phosphate synthase CbiB n=1 Tax=Parabacteroides sp. PFB2-10 TaxID=1742405 RepID=UPI00247431E7|nr:adenosylcobinamide-phosphate synthase CbiB [Parabacteroides sp. PFB2-10]MDH6313722.1 adenosylcobinamide-phosphate synthase [Parabacteroides sp. PFB2-10]
MDLICLYRLIPLLTGWIADRLFGDPPMMPHPVVGFGKVIAWGEKTINKGKRRKAKGAFFSISLIVLSFLLMYALLAGFTAIHPSLAVVLSAIVVFYCLAGKTLIKEVRQVFVATDRSVEEGRRQVARIVGRDTFELSPQQVRTAALETLAENLNDGVIAPIFWFLVLGAPGMFAYKMVNTLDSMIGYKNERYKEFGCWAARIDDIANYIPARLTAALMVIASGNLSLFAFVRRQGRHHASPNSGYPEAALAGILGCRFGGPNSYFGQRVDKPYIGERERELTTMDMQRAIQINRRAEIGMLLCVVIVLIVCTFVDLSI